MALEDLIKNSEQMHVYSKTPANPTLNQSLAVNKGGHTIDTSDIWSSDIPWFGAGQFDTFDAAMEAIGDKLVINDLIKIGETIHKKVAAGTSSDSFEEFVFDDNPLKNSKDEEVLVYHKDVTFDILTGANNSKTDSNRYAARLFKDGVVVERLIGVTDKIVNGYPSTGFRPNIKFVIGDTEKTLVEGVDYFFNAYAGMIQFVEKVPANATIKCSCFEYIGKKLNAELERAELQDNKAFAADDNRIPAAKDVQAAINHSTPAITSGDINTITIDTSTTVGNEGITITANQATLTTDSKRFDIEATKNGLTSGVNVQAAIDKAASNVNTTLTGHINDTTSHLSETEHTYFDKLENSIKFEDQYFPPGSNIIVIDNKTLFYKKGENNPVKYYTNYDLTYLTPTPPATVPTAGLVSAYEVYTYFMYDLNGNKGKLTEHTENTDIHITSSERTKWDGAALTVSTAIQDITSGNTNYITIANKTDGDVTNRVISANIATFDASTKKFTSDNLTTGTNVQSAINQAKSEANTYTDSEIKKHHQYAVSGWVFPNSETHYYNVDTTSINSITITKNNVIDYKDNLYIKNTIVLNNTAESSVDKTFTINIGEEELWKGNILKNHIYHINTSYIKSSTNETVTISVEALKKK